MSRSKKKRNKAYKGADSANARPSVVKISATERSKFGDWWFERKRFLKPVLITSAVVLLIGWLIFELVRIVTN